jgi:RNA polymerase sigma factor (sigma-70 family)
MGTDFELLEAWRQGDAKAGNQLFDRYFDVLFRFFRNKVSEGAEDLVQQTFLALVQSRDSFRGDSSFRTYLFTAARSKLYTYLDRRARDGVVDYGITSCLDLGISPSAAYEKNQQHRELLQALRMLPVDLQVALELFYFERVRGPELAAVIGVPEGTVRSRLRRGRELLRERLLELQRSPALVESTLTDLDQWAAQQRERAGLDQVARSRAFAPTPLADSPTSGPTSGPTSATDADVPEPEPEPEPPRDPTAR